MPIGWIISNIVLWVVVICETVLLLLLLRALGEIKKQGSLLSKGYTNTLDDGGLNIGEKAPAFTASDYRGNIISLNDFDRQQRILAFIFPGCSACTDALEALNYFAQDNPNKELLVVGSPDSKRNQAYATEHHAKMTILTPTPELADETYRIQKVPFIFVIDEAGIIQAKGVVNKVEQLQALLLAAETSLLNVP